MRLESAVGDEIVVQPRPVFRHAHVVDESHRVVVDVWIRKIRRPYALEAQSMASCRKRRRERQRKGARISPVDLDATYCRAVQLDVKESER